MVAESTLNDQVTVGLTSSLILERTAIGQVREEFILANVSDGGQVISLSLSDSQDATAGAGIVLSPGQTLQDTNNLPHMCWQGKIRAISNLAGAKLAIYLR